MNHQAQYNVTPDLQGQAARQMFVAVYLKKKWIGIIMFFAISIIALIYRDEFGWVPFSIFGSLSFIITTMWIKTYLTLQENAKAYLRTISDPKTTLVIDDKEMQISNFNGMKRFKWIPLTGSSSPRIL